MLGRPVKVAMTRPQVFYTTTHRTASEQHLRLGADRNGQLVAYGQDALVQSARFDAYTEPVCAATRMLYAAPNRLTRHRRAKLDLPRSDSMRAPGEAIGLLGLECAMDELADALGLDPVELRLRNDTPIDPETKKPFSSRHLAEALREGAARFGWDKRAAKPASVRDGRWLIGLGVASAIRRTGDDRHRDRHLHDPHSDRRRDDGDAGRTRRRPHGRYPLSADGGLGRLVRIRHVRRGGSGCLPETQGRARLRDDGSGRIRHTRRAR
jgi:CO/xanthine dehydrogenase Mo-binding subunit